MSQQSRGAVDVVPIMTVGITVRQVSSPFNKYLLTKRRARFLGSEGSSWLGPGLGLLGGPWEEEVRPQCVN